MEASAVAPKVRPEGRLGNPDKVLRDEERLHPRLLATLDEYGLAGRGTPVGLTPQSPLEEQRRHIAEAHEAFEGLYAALPNELPGDRDDVDVTQGTVPAEDGHPIELRIYRKQGLTAAVPCVIYLHGGAMTMMTAFNKVHQRWCKDIASTGVLTIGVDFRNAWTPEGGHPFPTGLNDCAAVVNWVHAHREELGVTKLVLMGESGGANLALATTLKAKRDGDLAAIDGVYATVPYISGGYGWDEARKAAELPSLLASDDYFIGCESITILAATYDPSGENAENPLAWPYFAQEEDLVGLPPHVIVVEELDPLRDEGIAYYRKLARAGVRVVGRVNLGLVHAAEMIFRQAVPDDYFMTVDDIKRFAHSV